MALKGSQKQAQWDEKVEESSEEIVDWLDKHRQLLVRAAAALGALVVVVAAGTWWSASERREAQRLFAQGLSLLRPPAAAGAPATPKPAEALAAFESAASKGGGSPVGLSSRYYHAVCLLELGRGAEAVPLLERVAADARHGALADAARALLAQAHESAGAPDKAEAIWRELAAATDGTFPADVALLRLGQLQARQGKAEEARRTFQDVVTRFPQGGGAVEARAALGVAGQ